MSDLAETTGPTLQNPRPLFAHIRNATVVNTIPTYIGYCCREWVLAIRHKGRCGLCGEVPTYLRPDDGGPLNVEA